MFSRDPSGSVLSTGRRAAAVALGLLAAVVVPAAAGETEPGPRAEIRLQNVRWQALPPEVMSVYGGPDGRLWYAINTPEFTEKLELIRQSVEREFRKEAPLIRHARPVLFEPGGRVWFLDQRTSKQLLGYDGKAWVEREARSDRNYYGWCPGHGPATLSGPNLFVDGKAWFIESRGLAVFDGHAWAYHPFPDGASRSWALLPEADGRGFLAVGQGGEPLLRFAGGEWARPPFLEGLSDERILAAAPGPDRRVWVRRGADGVALVFSGPRQAEEVLRLVEALRSSDYHVREHATQELIDQGPFVRGPVEKALAESRDPEVQYRLKDVLESMKRTDSRSGVMGPYRVSKVRRFSADPRGGVQVFAEEIREGGKVLGPGLVLADAQGHCRAVLGPSEKLAEGLARRDFVDAGLPTPKGDGLWLQGDDVTPVRLLGLEKGEIVDQLPNARFWYIHTVAADGTVFVGPGREREAGPLYAYKPGAPEKR